VGILTPNPTRLGEFEFPINLRGKSFYGFSSSAGQFYNTTSLALSQENKVQIYVSTQKPRSLIQTETKPKIRLPRLKPPMGKRRRKKRIKSPKGSKESKTPATSPGAMAAKMREPSSGGMGMRFKAARIRLILVVMTRIGRKNERLFGDRKRSILKSKAAKTAISKLVPGPAKPTKPISLRPSRKLKGSIGTGLAAPKTTGEPEKIRSRGKNRLIKGSMCGIGFKVKRPESLAVGSPRRSAIKP